ncbi:MAG: FHA domain-containing protein, partial [Planctomycetota bacterium]
MARLFVLSGTSVGATFDIDGTVVLGRGDDADVVVREPSVSRRHARLVPQPEAGVWKVVDLDSANGVHSDGRRVRDALVRDGETFVIGNVEIRLRDQVESEPGAVATDAEPDRAAVVDDD